MGHPPVRLIVQFPQRFLGLILPTVRAEHTHHVCLRHVLLRERSHDALDVRPLRANQLLVRFSSRLDEAIRVVFWVLKSDEAIECFVEVWWYLA